LGRAGGAVAAGVLGLCQVTSRMAVTPGGVTFRIMHDRVCMVAAGYCHGLLCPSFALVLHWSMRYEYVVALEQRACC
jgi:hypothetical protein